MLRRARRSVLLLGCLVRVCCGAVRSRSPSPRPARTGATASPARRRPASARARRHCSTSARRGKDPRQHSAHQRTHRALQRPPLQLRAARAGAGARRPQRPAIRLDGSDSGAEPPGSGRQSTAPRETPAAPPAARARAGHRRRHRRLPLRPLAPERSRRQGDHRIRQPRPGRTQPARGRTERRRSSRLASRTRRRTPTRA